jgi:putative AdoMet-dependent methyltransferase
MLDEKGFNAWSETYDRDTSVSDKDNTYPFAGYNNLLQAAYDTVCAENPKSILDIGIGTGFLSKRLYDKNMSVTGIDFSEEMLLKCKEVMPNATLIQHDFTVGMPTELKSIRFDAILSTYALHHIPDNKKADFFAQLYNYLSEEGIVILGDIAFPSSHELEACRMKFSDRWDDSEAYMVAEELMPQLSAKYTCVFHQISFCAGILVLRKSK